MRLLIIQTAFIGDLVMSTPILRAAREVFPEAVIDVLTIPASAILLKHCPHIDNIITFNKKSGFLKKTYNIIKLILTLKNNKYDLAIALQHSLTSSFLMYFGRIPERLGNRHVKFVTKLIKIPKGLHIRQRVLEYLKPFSDKLFSDNTEIFLSDIEIRKAQEIIEHTNIAKARIISIAPGSVRQTKKWSSDNYKILTKMLAENNYTIYLIGSREEATLCNEIRDYSKSPNVHNYSGKLDLLESAALIKESDLLICNDSSPLHIANAVETDVFAFFGPTVKEFGCYPWRQRDVILEVDLECRPCKKHGSNKCPLGHHNCMNMISPGQVYNITQKRYKSL